MVDMVAPNGAVVSARDEAVRALLDAGFTKAEPPAKPKPAPRRRTAKRTTMKR